MLRFCSKERRKPKAGSQAHFPKPGFLQKPTFAMWPQPQPLAVQFPVALCGHGNLPVTCGMPGGSLTWPVAVCRLDHWQLSCLNRPPALAFARTVIVTVTNSPLETNSVACYSATSTDSDAQRLRVLRIGRERQAAASTTQPHPRHEGAGWRRSTFASSACSRAQQR
jgi:hypothetical protein